MTSVSSSLSGNALYSSSLAGLDTNGDGIVSAEERAAAEQSAARKRTQDPTVENENAASGVSGQIAGDMIAMLLAHAGDETQSEDRPHDDEVGPVDRVAADNYGDDDTVSIFDVLDEMSQVIAAYSAYGTAETGDAEVVEKADITL